MATRALSKAAIRARDTKNAAMALTAQALASPPRLRLLGVLAQADHTVDALSEKVEQSRANTSAHLKVLASAGLVVGRRAGKNVVYALASPEVRSLLAALQATALAQSAELRELLHTFYELPEALTRVRAKELLAQVRKGEVVLLDLRPEDEFRFEHPEGAINVPLDELERRVDALPDGREIVAYCRGRHCVLAVEGVNLLRKLGGNVQNLGASSRELIVAGAKAVRAE